MPAIVDVDDLRIDQTLYDFVNHEAMPGTGIQKGQFWSGFSSLVRALAPKNAALLRRRDELQSKIDAWHQRHPGAPLDRSYKAFLMEIGYLVPEQAPFTIATAGIDREIAEIAGPQLVVPVNNARYALNAANARWGSLYDALYGTDAIAQDGPRVGKYDPQRGAKVVSFVRNFLDEHFALAEGSHHDAAVYRADAQG